MSRVGMLRSARQVITGAQGDKNKRYRGVWLWGEVHEQCYDVERTKRRAVIIFLTTSSHSPPFPITPNCFLSLSPASYHSPLLLIPACRSPSLSTASFPSPRILVPLLPITAYRFLSLILALYPSHDKFLPHLSWYRIYHFLCFIINMEHRDQRCPHRA